MKMTIARRFWLWTILAVFGFCCAGYLGYHLSSRQQKALQTAQKNTERMAALFQGSELFQQTMENYQKAIVKIMLGESPEKILVEMQQTLKAFSDLDMGIAAENKDKLLAFLNAGMEKIKKNNSYDAAELMSASDNPAEALRKWLTERVEEQKANTDRAAVESNIETRSIRGFVAFSFLIIALVLTGFSMLNIYHISRPILAGVGMLIQVAEQGDISCSVPEEYMARSDEIGQLARAVQNLIDSQKKQAMIVSSIANGNWVQDVTVRSEKDVFSHALKDMIVQMNRKLLEVNEVSSQVNIGAKAIGTACDQLSQAATVSAASLQEISSTMTEVDSRAKQNAKDAQIASELVLKAKNNAEKGSEHMFEMVNAMQDIRGSSQQIARIIKVIDDIAFQTNLLALNAAVEAARAGRHGKGFAVVADEVRNLAGRSAKAARETSELIDSSEAKVEKGAAVVNQNVAALKDMAAGISKAADIISNIAAVSNEQAVWIAEISTGLGQIDSATQQNSANAEEIAASAVQLSSHATMLHEGISTFQLSDKI